MDNKEIEEKVKEFLNSLGVSSFIVFGWQKNEKEFGIVSSQHKMPSKAVIKGMSWALNDYISKSI